MSPENVGVDFSLSFVFLFLKYFEFGAFYFFGYRNMVKAFYEVLDPHLLSFLFLIKVLMYIFTEVLWKFLSMKLLYVVTVWILYPLIQFFESGFGSRLDQKEFQSGQWIRIRNPDPDPGEQK
jgi:hypothetical protein